MPLPKEPKQRVPFSPFDEETVKDRSKKQERALAKRFDGRLQPASGAFRGHKGDVKTGALLIEAKTTKRKSYSVTLATLRKIGEEARLAHRTPVLSLRFEIDKTRTEEWAVVPLSMLEDLL